MSFATHRYPDIPPTERPALRTHSSTSSTSTSSSISSISSASSAASSSPQSRPIIPGSSKQPSAPHHQPARRTAGPISPLLMLVHPHAPIHTPIPPSLHDRRASLPNLAAFTAPLVREQPWLDNAEFRTPTGTPTSAPSSACSSPFFNPRPILPPRKSAESAAFPLHSQRH